MVAQFPTFPLHGGQVMGLICTKVKDIHLKYFRNKPFKGIMGRFRGHNRDFPLSFVQLLCHCALFATVSPDTGRAGTGPSPPGSEWHTLWTRKHWHDNRFKEPPCLSAAAAGQVCQVILSSYSNRGDTSSWDWFTLLFTTAVLHAFWHQPFKTQFTGLRLAKIVFSLATTIITLGQTLTGFMSKASGNQMKHTCNKEHKH